MKWFVGFVLLLSFAVINSAEAQSGDVQIGGVVYADMNENGLRDDTELGLGGMPLELYDEAGETLLETTSADLYGSYSFTTSAGKYRVKFSNGSPDTGFSDIIDASNGRDQLEIHIGVAPEGFGEPTAISKVSSRTGISTEGLILGTLALLVLMVGLFMGRRRGLI